MHVIYIFTHLRLFNKNLPLDICMLSNMIHFVSLLYHLFTTFSQSIYLVSIIKNDFHNSSMCWISLVPSRRPRFFGLPMIISLYYPGTLNTPTLWCRVIYHSNKNTTVVKFVDRFCMYYIPVARTRVPYIRKCSIW